MITGIKALIAQSKRNKAARLAEIEQGIADFFDDNRPVKAAIVQGWRTSACMAFYAHDSKMASRVHPDRDSAADWILDAMYDETDRSIAA